MPGSADDASGEGSGARERTRGDALVDELLWVHGAIRRDLEVLRELAARVESGAEREAERVREQVLALESSSPVWQLRYGCLHWCRHVHGHHSFEDAAWFPAIRVAAPGSDSIIDRLEAEHEAIHQLVEQVIDGANELVHAVRPAHEEPAGEVDPARVDAAGSGLAAAFTELADDLDRHLGFEEDVLIPVLREITEWPPRAPA